ncbi:Cysteine-rich secretory protein family protein [Roseovarius sp. THAF9]|uniref:CAP domain-containing protein n=1 Tax=Roseovarius sp. THAF9 TaxID=2587847 RepID=UPI0012688187|nr:CAP domain-containing protein [Roseovarius sp. THAF9]QFT93468.1 Cysteine-rich secretory protein family protein [Roseovarius sp. THAF9]
MRLHAILLASLIALAPLAAEGQDVANRGQAALAWINAFRAKEGRAPLKVSRSLTRAAAAHAADMARKGYFSHSGSDGSSIADRARRAGYRFCFIAENIAKGQRDVNGVLIGWEASTGHRNNMLAREADHVALVEAPGRIWVMMLGRDGC